MNVILMERAIEELEAKEAKVEQDIIDLKADVIKIKEDIKEPNP